MEFDDSGEKIRRNLLGFSALILVSAFLGDTITREFIAFGLRFDAVPKLKLWVTVTAVLLYLALRFRFTDTTKAAQAAFRVERTNFARKRIHRHLDMAAKALLRDGRESSLFLDNAAIRADFDARFRIPGTEQNPDHKVNIAVGEVFHDYHKGDFHIENDGEPYAPFGRRYSYELPRSIRLKLWANVYMRALYTKGFVELGIPYLAFFAALSICGYRLAIALISLFP